MRHVDTEAFRGRYAKCPLCARDNVRLVYYMGGIVLDEHASDNLVSTYAEPVGPDGSIHVMAAAKSARVRSPLSLASVVQPEEDVDP